MTSPSSIVVLTSTTAVTPPPAQSVDAKTARECELMQRVIAGETELFY